MKLKLWKIPRADHRERCASCLRAFSRRDATFPDDRFNGYRFKRVGVCCRIIK